MSRVSNIFLFISLLWAVYGNVSAQTRSAIREKDLARQTDAENLNVFQQWIVFNNAGSFLANHLIGEAMQYYEKRDKIVATLKTRADWTRRQGEVRNTLMEILGSFPERTALNPVITGTIRHQEYRIEKVVYESQPGSYVTGCLYIPETPGRMPAILNLIGHEQESFRAELDQVMATNLAKKGMIVMTIDPPGQGEHLQYFDPAINFSSIGYSVVEHCYFGNQGFLSGISSARHFIWDAMRAIDYLVSRGDVDAARIGVTGFSGGGTITSYVGALDDRVSVAIPSSWSTSNRQQIRMKGAQDAEANLIRGLSKGITFEDLIEARAPRPTMMTFVSRDEYLTLQGAREAYDEAKEVYRIMGAADNLHFVEDDAKHWLTPKIREGIYGFFLKHFGLTGDAKEEDADIFSAEQLKVTSNGQIASSLGGNMIFDDNQKHTRQLVARLQKSRLSVETHLKTVPEKVKEISGYREPTQGGEPLINGRYQRNGYTVTKFALESEGEYPLPILFFIPDGKTGKHPAIIYLNPEGKHMGAQSGGEIEDLVKRGYIVASVDLPGVGELRNSATTDIATNNTAVLIGRSIVAVQAGAIVKVADFLSRRQDVNAKQIGGYGIGTMNIPLLHAAALSTRISEVALIRPLISYRSVATNRKYRIGLIERKGGGTHHPYDIDFSWGVAGVLTGYDLPDLIGCLAPRRVLISDFQDHNLEQASRGLVDEEMVFPLAAYRLKKAQNNLTIISKTDNPTTVSTWFFR